MELFGVSLWVGRKTCFDAMQHNSFLGAISFCHANNQPFKAALKDTNSVECN